MNNFLDYCYFFHFLKTTQLVFLTQSMGKEHSGSSNNSQNLMLLSIFFLTEKDAQNTSLSQVSYDCSISAGRIKFSSPAQRCLAIHVAQMHGAETDLVT